MKRGLDVIVVGAGNAALCTALSAREQGASVLVLEAAPRNQLGGNSYFTDGAVRVAFRHLADLEQLVPALTSELAGRVDAAPYTAEQYENDLVRVSDGKTDRRLARLLANRSYPTIRWLSEQGVRFELILDNQAFEIAGKHRFWGGLMLRTAGRGTGLIGALLSRVESLGIEVWDTAPAVGLEMFDGKVTGVHVGPPRGPVTVGARCVVLACGGFEANPDQRERHLGSGWRGAIVRGSPFNQGAGLRMAFAVGAQPCGDWRGCHAVATDVNAPPVGDFTKPGDVFKKHSYPFGIIVNRDGHRFVDEGADFRNYTYARYGREILRQPGGVAFQVFDGQVRHLLRSEYFHEECTRFEADTIENLAAQIEIDRTAFLETVTTYNTAVQDGPFDPHVRDGKQTRGIDPQKSNWALRLERPPFVAFPVKCGITFTYGGLRIDTSARVLDRTDMPIPGLYAAGELVGGLFYENYPGGSGLMSGAVFGRIAGTHAGREALQRS